MKVKDVMIARSLKSCTPDTKLLAAAKMMKATNCGALPVIDKSKKVIGIITDRDITLSLTKKKITPLEDKTVAEVMTKKVFTVQSDDEVSKAYQSMRKNQVGRLPVLDKSGKLSGIVSLHSLIDKAVHKGKFELGTPSASGENLIKTIQSVMDRYNGKKEKEVKKKEKLFSTY